jgi:glycerophosphoryl diester phosphodiesterase
MSSRYTILSVLLASALLICSCERKHKAPLPDSRWDLFESADAQPLPSYIRPLMEGIYSIEGTEAFGSEAALKWTYAVEKKDTAFYLSAFCNKDVAFFVLQGKKLGDMLLFSGYWRKMVSTETGPARFTIKQGSSAALLPGPSARSARIDIRIEGTFGTGMPDKPVVLSYKRPLYTGKPFEVLGHRCGGRTSDLLPASENSLGMIKLASRLGSTGVEMDVRLTSDGIPVIYHDETLNERLVKPNGMQGNISRYTYRQLYDLVRLRDGERIPTLRDALETIVCCTPLTLVWIDMKYQGSFEETRRLQAEYEEKARSLGRDVRILIGISSPEMEESFLALSDHRSSKCLTEQLESVEKVSAYAWGARWTLGTQNAEVEYLQSQGRKAYVWTMDVPEFIEQYIRESRFDGILSNFPSIVAYYHYARQ